MEGEGPSAGDPTNVEALLASFDCVSLDVVASQLTSFRPEEILTSVDAIERGIGPESLEEVKTVGEELKDLIKKDFKKPVLYRNSAVRSLRQLLTPLGINIFRVFPKLNQSRCSRCGLCEEKCPVGAIRLDSLPLINNEECIQCFVCHEFCPEGAIELKRSWIARRLQRR